MLCEPVDTETQQPLEQLCDHPCVTCLGCIHLGDAAAIYKRRNVGKDAEECVWVSMGRSTPSVNIPHTKTNHISQFWVPCRGLRRQKE